jgi:hypothetical protein
MCYGLDKSEEEFALICTKESACHSLLMTVENNLYNVDRKTCSPAVTRNGYTSYTN